MDRLDLSGEDYLADLASIFAYDEPQSRDQPAFPKEIHLKRPNSKRKARSGAASSAARSKRYRERKANELQEVVAEQQWLKRERSDLLAKLALLQQEVQALRGRSVVDFERENRLLRAEIAVSQPKNTKKEMEINKEIKINKSTLFASGSQAFC